MDEGTLNRIKTTGVNVSVSIFSYLLVTTFSQFLGLPLEKWFCARSDASFESDRGNREPAVLSQAIYEDEDLSHSIDSEANLRNQDSQDPNNSSHHAGNSDEIQQSDH